MISASNQKINKMEGHERKLKVKQTFLGVCAFNVCLDWIHESKT